MFQEFYIGDKDILNGGSVACAYYTSNILKQFNLTTVGRANVPRIIDDIKSKGRKEIDASTPAADIPIGSILIWETRHGETHNRDHHHIGFYMGDEIAISNNSNGYQTVDGSDHVPVRHHYTYDGTRTLTQIFTRDWSNPFADWLYHNEIDIPFVCAVGDEQLTKQGLSEDEIIYRSGKNEGLQYGKVCGAACVAMAVHYFNNNSVTLKDCIAFAETPITYFNEKTQQDKTVTCFVPGIGRYHSGLTHMALELGKNHGVEINGSIHHIEKDSVHSLIQQSIKNNIDGQKNCIIASVTLGFDTTKETKGGHLVVVIGLDYNGLEYSIVVLDPIEKGKKQIPLQQFLDSFSGNYILLEKTSQ